MVLTRKAPTIQDVARHAKVSAATVSRVLSTPDRVSEATRERVYDAVRQTGYTVNEAARSLRMQRSRVILAAMPGIGNPFYSAVLEAVVTQANARGYGVLVTSRLGADPATWLADYLHSNRADGLLVFDGFLDTKALHTIAGKDAGLPLVAAYDELPDPQINSVLTDNLQASERMVRHLYDLGHRRIGHLSGQSRNTFPNERLVGFRKAMFDLGLELHPEWIVQGDYTMAGGEAAAEKFISLPSRPTAIFAGNDDSAIGLIAGLRRRGIECPRDISIAGFDDITVAQNYLPSITTMRQPREQIGRLATDTLIDIIEGTRTDTVPARIMLTSELVVRESTAPPPHSIG